LRPPPATESPSPAPPAAPKAGAQLSGHRLACRGAFSAAPERVPSRVTGPHGPAPRRGRPASYLHREAATLDTEAPGSRREAVDDHLGVLRVGVVDGQEALAGGTDAQAAEAEEWRPGEEAQDQHGRRFLRLRLLLAAPHRPAPPLRAGGGAQLPHRRRGEHAGSGTPDRDRDQDQFPSAPALHCRANCRAAACPFKPGAPANHRAGTPHLPAN